MLSLIFSHPDPRSAEGFQLAGVRAQPSFHWIWLGWVFFSWMGCVKDEQTIPEPLPAVTAQTLLRSAGDKEQIVSRRESLVIPAELLEVRQIVRARVELREGPGGAYALGDRLLAQGDRVIVLDQYSRWRKILSLPEQITGWLHEATLSPETVKQGEFSVKLTYLPAIFAASVVKNIYDYETLRAIQTKFPKGTRFYRLRKVGQRHLILMEDTLSVAWINEGDVI